MNVIYFFRNSFILKIIQLCLYLNKNIPPKNKKKTNEIRTNVKKYRIINVFEY